MKINAIKTSMARRIMSTAMLAAATLGVSIAGAKNTSKLSDAQDALVVLGYSRNEALKALQTIDTNALDLDDIIRLALKKLMK